jgi:hypothetical protein
MSGSSGGGRDAEVRDLIASRAEEAGMRDARVLVSSDGFGGLRVRVVHPALAPLDGERRRELLLAGIADEITVAELVTPDEEEWYGFVFSESEGGLVRLTPEPRFLVSPVPPVRRRRRSPRGPSSGSRTGSNRPRRGGRRRRGRWRPRS